MTAPILADLYAAAADEIENRDNTSRPFVAGPNVWRAIHGAVFDVITSPAVEGLRRHLHVDQVQHWRADEATVVKTLRELADEPEQLDLLRAADAENRIEQARKQLRDALGQPGADGSLYQLADEVAGRIKRLESENARLEAEVKRLSGQLDKAHREGSA
jgi:hypothetical protein